MRTTEDLIEQCAAAVHFCRDDADAHEIANAVLAIARPAIRKEALGEAAKVAETEGVYPELNIFAGGPEWYKHGRRIATAIRALVTTGQEGGR